ncbi:Uncharacterised protein [uncultured Clostridium sp.]
MYNSLAAVCEDMQSNGISVVECELKSNPSLCMEKGRIVGYDRRKFGNEAECCTALIHEDGHFESGAFYKPFSVYQVKQQAENKAWRSAFRKRIPWCELKSEILKGFSVWEIAEHFNVTAQCIWDAYLYYRDVCGVCMQEDT